MDGTRSPEQTPLLWERLRALFERVIAAIGAPAVIVALTLAPRVRTHIVRQLALVEILARKLLLAEAAVIISPSPQRGPRLVEIPLNASGLYTLPSTRRIAQARPKAKDIDLTKPESWDAPFALAIPRDQRNVSGRDAPRIRALWGDAPRPSRTVERAPVQRRSDAFLVARRAEALRRLLQNPHRT